MLYFVCVMKTFQIYTDSAQCVYDVVPETNNTGKDDQARVSAFVELDVSWKFSNKKHCYGGLLSMPPPFASTVIVVFFPSYSKY